MNEEHLYTVFPSSQYKRTRKLAQKRGFDMGKRAAKSRRGFRRVGLFRMRFFRQLAAVPVVAGAGAGAAVAVPTTGCGPSPVPVSVPKVSITAS